MEINKCNICSGGGKEIFKLAFNDLQGAQGKKYIQKLYFCKKCGFLFTSNPFSEEQLSNRYKNFSKYEFDSSDYILEESDGYKKRCTRQFNFINAAVGEDFSSVLEIGAASGYNLSLYSDKEVYGIEPSLRNCQLAQKYYHVDMYNGMFAEFIEKASFKKYDLLFLSHVLEHIVNPRDFILDCKRICDKYIFIEVPSMDYKFVEEPMGMFCEEHVNYFTLESLSNLMNSVGFALVDVNYIFGLHDNLPAGWPAMSTIWEFAENSSQSQRKPILDSELIIKTYIDKNIIALNELKRVIAQIPKDKKLAVWGTGHHASMLLANTSLAEKNIVRVYDSDVRKHVYTFNGVSISSFNESDIYDKKIDCILVATYTAQKAIRKILDKYKNICELYYLYDL